MSEHERFVRAVKDVGPEILEDLGWSLREDYRGRNLYRGPAVVVPRYDLEEVIRLTDVPLTWDDLGKHSIVVHPRNR